MIKNKPTYHSTFIQLATSLLILLLSISPISPLSAQFPLTLDTLLPGDTLEIFYDVGVKNLAANVTEVSSQVKVTGSNFSDVLSDDPDDGTSNMDPTVTPACPTPEAAYSFTTRGLEATFIDQSPAASTWLWDFGDGNTSTMSSPTHTYAVAGTYTVCLTVTTSCGADSVCKTVVTCDPAVAGFTSVISGKDVTFTNSSSLATSHLWDFGDSNTSAQESPVHTYVANGDYTVTLIAINNCKNDTLSQIIQVCDLPPGIVFNTNDDGCGSLRRVVSNAASGDTIRFDASINTMPILLDSQIVLDKNLVMIGNDTTKTIIDGQQQDRVFSISTSNNITISGVTIQKGMVDGAGAGIHNSGILCVIACRITKNFISMGGSSKVGGGIFNNGSLASVKVINSSICGNVVITRGGGVYNDMGTIVLENTLISGNSVTGGGGFSDGGGIYNRGVVKNIHSSITNNSVLLGSGGGVYNLDSITFINSVISGNAAGGSIGGGILNSGVAIFNNVLISGNTAGIGGGGIWNNEDIILDNTTVTGNKATTDGGGICITFNTSSAELTNSIISLNSAPNGPDIQVDGGSTITSSYCIIGHPGGDHFIMHGVKGNQVGTTANPLDPLFIMNVDTMTLPNTNGDLHPQSCSPAINAGINDSLTIADSVDLDGNPRIFEGIVDIGAYEFQMPLPDPLIVSSTDDSGCGSLRFAVAAAINGDTIRFDPSIDMDTIKLDSQIVLDKNLVIIGNDTTKTIIDGQQQDRIFEITMEDSVWIEGITLTNGKADQVQQKGGAIKNNGLLNLGYCKIIGNMAYASGGGISSSKILILNHTSVLDNHTYGMVLGFGGGIASVPGSNDSIVINNSIIGGNTALNDASGGGLFNGSKGSVRNTRITGNSAIVGGGISNLAEISITNSVISGNTSIGVAGLDASGGGLYNFSMGSEAFIINSSISGNRAENGYSGGGIASKGSVTLTNTIVAKNYDDNSGPDIFKESGTITDNGNNLIGDNGSVETEFPLGPLVGVDPLFEMEVDTTTLPNKTGDLRLQCTSPAINAGTPDTSGLNLGLVDLGSLPRVVENVIDIGAYEKSLICQEIQVVHKGVQIDSIDVTPSKTDGTDYEEVCGMSMDSFYIKNVRAGNLIVDTIKVDPHGSNTGAFTFNESDFTFPDTIMGGDSVLLKIIFDPSTSGIDTAAICIGNNDSDENPFTFLVSATLDTTAPAAICQDINIFLDKNGNASITPDQIDNGSTDNCGTETYMLDQSSFTCANLGPNQVVLTVMDTSGNSDTCHATVTVEDIPISSTPHIVGMSPVCPGMTNVPYSVVPDPDVTSYQWSYSGSGASILNNGSPSININFAANATAGILSVEYITACGPSGIKDNFSVAEASAFTCALAMNCPDNLWVINTMIGFPGSINLFKANINVFSAVTIETDETVLFRSGSEINLLPNFEVELGALFSAEIQGCGESFDEGVLKKKK